MLFVRYFEKTNHFSRFHQTNIRIFFIKIQILFIGLIFSHDDIQVVENLFKKNKKLIFM